MGPATAAVVAGEDEVRHEQHGRDDEEPDEPVNHEPDDAQDDVQHQGYEKERQHAAYIPGVIAVHRIAGT